MEEHGFFYTFLIGPFTKDSIIFGLIGLVFWGLALLLISLFLLLIFDIIDSTFMPRLKGRGKITKKRTEKAYDTTTYYKVGDVMVPRSHHHKKEYVLTIKIGDKVGTVNVKKKFFNEVNVEDEIDCEYSLGRIFNETMNIKKIK